MLHAGGENGFIKGAGLIFCSKKKTDDYHDNMTASLFEKWLQEQLLPALQQPTVVVLDNAPYHSSLVEAQPTSSWRKQQLLDWLKQQNIVHSSDLLKNDLLKLAKCNLKCKQYRVDKIIQEHGHQVLRLPPYHCQYNPIEMIWSTAKRY